MKKDTQIPEQTMQMLNDEAWSVFEATLHEGKGWQEAFRTAVSHAMSHALEEGIVAKVESNNTATARLIETLHSGKEILAPTTWAVLAHEYAYNGTPEAAQELAQKVLAGVR